MHQLTRCSLCAIFWRKTKRPLYPSYPTLQIWLQQTFFCFLSWSLPWKDAVSTHLTRSRRIRRRSCSPFRKKRSKVGRNAGSSVLLAKETTLKATDLNKLYLSTYSFYYNSPVFYWSYLVLLLGMCCCINVEMSVFQTGIILSEWVQELPLFNPDAAGISLSSKEMLEIKYYKVLWWGVIMWWVKCCGHLEQFVTCHVNGVSLTCRFYLYIMHYHFHCCDQMQRRSFNVTLMMFSLSLANFSGGRSIERCLESD